MHTQESLSKLGPAQVMEVSKALGLNCRLVDIFNNRSGIVADILKAQEKTAAPAPAKEEPAAGTASAGPKVGRRRQRTAAADGGNGNVPAEAPTDKVTAPAPAAAIDMAALTKDVKAVCEEAVKPVAESGKVLTAKIDELSQKVDLLLEVTQNVLDTLGGGSGN